MKTIPRVNTILNSFDTWQNIPEALDGLKTAHQMGCRLAITFRLLFEAVERAAKEQNAGVVFMIQIVGGKVETPRQATERLWRLGCKLRVSGMGQARRELEAVNCNPETPEESEARYAQHREYEAGRAKAAMPKAKEQAPKPKSEPKSEPKAVPVPVPAPPIVMMERRTLSCEELFGIRKMPEGPEKQALRLGIVANVLTLPGLDNVLAHKRELVEAGKWTEEDEKACTSPIAIVKKDKRKHNKRKAKAETPKPSTPAADVAEDMQATA